MCSSHVIFWKYTARHFKPHGERGGAVPNMRNTYRGNSITEVVIGRRYRSDLEHDLGWAAEQI
jgi:hypothetical protein